MLVFESTEYSLSFLARSGYRLLTRATIFSSELLHLAVIFASYVIFYTHKLAIELEVSRKGAILITFIIAFTPSYILFSTLIKNRFEF